jgi:hypothetical protein
MGDWLVLLGRRQHSTRQQQCHHQRPAGTHGVLPAAPPCRRNLQVNGVEGRCEVLPGDCRATAPAGVADRVSLGLLPSSRGGWQVRLPARLLPGPA